MNTPKTVKDVDFGIFFFASSVDSLGDGKDLYGFLKESVRFADRNGFSSAWVPERHFTEFGFIYPNPALVLSGLATITERIRLCAGSLVSPLHNILRVAEDWSVLDNLSAGRVGASLAPGWNPDDFVLYPDRYSDRRDENFRNVRALRQLWKERRFTARNGLGKPVELQLFPPPYSPELPLWITASGTPETFRLAGTLGTNILTHLLDHELTSLSEKIELYRAARRSAGHDPETGTVTAMIHSFVGEDCEATREEARVPYCNFLKQNLNLAQGLAADRGHRVDVRSLPEKDVEAFLNFLYDRFVFERAFIGNPESCVDLAGRIFASGVDEIACLLDFGPPAPRVLENLHHLNRLKELCRRLPDAKYQRPALDQRDLAQHQEVSPGSGVAAVVRVERDISAVRERLPDEVLGAAFDAELQQTGWVLEKGQSGIEKVWRRDGEALGHVRLAEATLANESSSSSSFLERCFPVALAALPAALRETGSDAPFVLSSFRSHRNRKPPGHSVWVHATLQSGPLATGEGIEADLRVLDEAGDEIAITRGLRLERVELPVPEEDVQGWFYRERWDIKAPVGASPPDSVAHWLIFADRGGVGHALARELEGRGHSASIVTSAALANPAKPAAPWLDGSEASADLCSKTLRTILDHELTAARAASDTRVVFLWGLDTTHDSQTTPESLIADQFTTTGTLTLLIQALAAVEMARVPRLWVVSRGLKDVGPAAKESQPLAIAQAPLWGVGKTCAVEHPELWGGLVDLDADSTSVDESAADLGACLLAQDREDQVAVRNRQRHVVRVVRERVVEQRAFTLRNDAAYLITGGLKGFGFEVARWLVERGARHMILLGRTALPPREDWGGLTQGSPSYELTRNVLALESLGADVHHPALDVTSEARVQAFFQSYQQGTRPPIRGVFHCAAVWNGENNQTVILPLASTKVSAIAQIFPPKVVGSWLLSRYLDGTPLDFFVTFSAAAGLLGSAGQLIYTAANSFMDALAHDLARRNRQPALSINWGPIREVGSGATLEGRMMHQLAERRGLLGIEREQAMRALELLIPHRVPQVGVMRTNWELLVQSYTGMLSAPWASELVEGMPAVEQEDLVAALKEARAEDRMELLCATIQRLVVLVMGYSLAEAPELDQGLFDIGLDSLLGLELKNHIQAKLRKDFPTTAIFDYPSIRRLSEYLLTEVLALPIAETVTLAPPSEERNIFEEIDLLSEAEVEARLARQLAMEAAR